MKEKKYRMEKEGEMYRIYALKNFADLHVGDKGGLIERAENLSQEGASWVYCDAVVTGTAKVTGNAVVTGYALVTGTAEVTGYAEVTGAAVVTGAADYIVFKNWWSSGRYFTWTKSNDMWKVGCFTGTGEELVAKAYADSELSGREYERIVNYVNQLNYE